MFRFAPFAALAIALLAGPSAGAAEPLKMGVVPSFVEETASAGISSTFTGDWKYIVGGGVAAFDCNGDGFPEMYLAGGEKPAKFYLNESTQGGALKFKEQPSGLEMTLVVGAYPLDIDSDGIMDLVVLKSGQSVAMRGLGDCRFEDASQKWSFYSPDIMWWTAFSATFEHGATWPTIALGSYISITHSLDMDPWGSCTGAWLERSNASGDGFGEAIPLKPSWCPLSMLFSDWNRSGVQSLRISNDRQYYLDGMEQLFHVDPGQPPRPYTAEEGWQELKIWGMGIASADVNGDGYLDYYLTSMSDNKLQVLTEPAPASGPLRADYKDIAYKTGSIAYRPYTGGDFHPSTGWHAQFEDVNNDGFADLFVAKGNVSDMLAFAIKDPDNLMLGQPDGNFTEVGDKAGVASMEVGRGAALPDFNLDGLPDLVVVNNNHPAQVWRNTTADAGNWLDLRLALPGANRDAIGAWITVTAGDLVLNREITVGGGHVSGQATWIHFGLADMTNAQVVVTWPDGTKSEPLAVDANKFYVIAPGQPPQPWTPG